MFSPLINMAEGDISLKFRLRNVDETLNYFLEEIKKITSMIYI